MEPATDQTELDAIADAFSLDLGEAFFSKAASTLARLLAADHVLIGQLTGAEDSVTTLAACARGRLLENFEYRLENTPCAAVLSRQVCVFPSGIRQLFPRDPVLQDWKVESYAGAPLVDSLGRVLGVLAVLHSGPFPDSARVAALLRIFAVRIAIEMEYRLEDRQFLREILDRAVPSARPALRRGSSVPPAP